MFCPSEATKPAARRRARCAACVRPSPCPLVVKEEHQVEPLLGLLLPLLPQTEDVFGWDGDGHPVVQQALLGHLWVDDLKRSQTVAMSIFRDSLKTSEENDVQCQ